MTHGATTVRPLTERDVHSGLRLNLSPRQVDAAVVAVVAASSAASVNHLVYAWQYDVKGIDPWTSAWSWVALVAAVVGAAALWFRRRYPVVVLGTVTAAMLVFFAAAPGDGWGAGVLGFPFAVYAVARYRPPAAWWGLGLSLVSAGAVVAVSGEADPTVGAPLALAVQQDASLLMTGLLGLALGGWAYGRHQRATELVRWSAALVAEGERNVRLASMQERSRIAREMHDIVAHSLSVMIALAEGARAAAPKSPQAAAEALDLLAETGRTALTDMRRMLGVLRDGETLLTPQPTTDDDVAGLVEVFGQAGLTVRLHAEPLPDHPGLRLAVFRVVQEALTNVLRHARGASAADVEVRVVGGTVEVTVRDDGGTADGPVPSGTGSGGTGLIGMRQRAAMYGGEVKAGPAAGGWQVRATLTVPPPDPSVTAWALPS